MAENLKGFVQLLPNLRLIPLLSGASLCRCFLPRISSLMTPVPAPQCDYRILCCMHGVPSKEGAEHQDVGVFFIARPLWRGLREHESVAEAVS